MKRKFFYVGFVVAGLACMFIARVLVYQESWNSQTLLTFVHGVDSEKGKKVVVEGVVSADPDMRDTTLHTNIKVEKINGEVMRGTLIAFFPTDTKLEYGEHVTAKGTLRIPDVFQSDGGNMFDYPHYLQVQGISAMLTSATVSTSTPAPFSLQGLLYALRHTFDRSLERIFPAPEGPLLEGIILGERHGIPADLERAFIIASLIHIVVLSGHVFTLIADAVMRTLSFLPKKIRFPLAALFIVLFVMMVGATSIAIRSSVMAGIGMAARFFNRTSVAMRALLCAVIAVGIWNPPSLVWDSSFVLSVLATFGLITLSPRVEKWLQWMPEKFELRGIATSTISVQIFILPALLYYSGTLSYLALPANIVALPVLPWAMLAGFLAGLFGMMPGVIGLALAFVPACIAQLLLRWIIFIAQTVAHIPYAASVIYAFPLWAAACMYVPLVIAAGWSYRNAARVHPSSSF